MNCYISAIVGVGMLAASFATCSDSQEQQNKLRAQFSPELGKKYGEIVIERRNLYFQGLVLGLVVAFFATKWVAPMGTFHKTTFMLAVALPVAVIYYFLMPKSDYMLNHLKTPEDVQAWLSVYNHMKQRYFLGMLFGALATIPIAYAMCSAGASSCGCRDDTAVMMLYGGGAI